MDKLQNFVIWLDGFLDATGDNINISKTNLIKNKLNNLFEHVAEPVEHKSTPQDLGKQHGFQEIVGLPNYEHPDTDANGEKLYRC